MLKLCGTIIKLGSALKGAKTFYAKTVIRRVC